MLGQPPAHVMLICAESKSVSRVKNGDANVGLALANRTNCGDGNVRFDCIVPWDAHITFIKTAAGDRPDQRFIDVTQFRLFAVTEVITISPERVGKSNLA